jgi:hypothetical protein
VAGVPPDRSGDTLIHIGKEVLVGKRKVLVRLVVLVILVGVIATALVLLNGRLDLVGAMKRMHGG